MHRKQIRRWHKLLSASASVIAILGGVFMAPASANSAPSVDMFWADVSRTNQSAVTFYLMTSTTIKNLEASDFYVFGSATGCTVDENFSQSSFHVVTVRGCSDGTVAVQLGANSVSDLSMNWGPSQGFASDFTSIDRTAPEFTFDASPASVADASFNITASVSEQLQLADSLMAPTLSGNGCSLSGISIAAEKYTFAVTGCSVGAEAQITIYAKSYKDATGNLGPAQNVVCQIVKVQSAVLPLPIVSPSPTPTSTSISTSISTPTSTPTPTPTPTPTAASSTIPIPAPSSTPTSTPTSTPEQKAAAPLVVLPPIEPSAAAELVEAQEPALSLVPGPAISEEPEPVVPMAPIASIRAIESAASFELIAPPAPRRASSVAQAQAVQPETLTNPLPAPETETVIEPEPQIVVEASATAANLSWVMPAASVISGVFGAVAGALIVRSKLSRKPRLRMA